MDDEISKIAQSLKEQTKDLSQQESLKQFEKQKDKYETEYADFLENYKKESCYLCGKPIKTLSKSEPCLHWLLRKCKFKKKDFTKIINVYDFYNIEAYLRWVSHAESGVKNINNLREESSARKLFETTIKWKNVEWTLDCSKNDFDGHEGSMTDFPHWHFQMRVDGRQFINFNDFHIKFSKDDQLKLTLENDQESGFVHTFGPGGFGMQEHMDRMEENPEDFIANAITATDLEEGSVRMQSVIQGHEGGISGDKINEALEMSKETGKTIAYCLEKVLVNEKGISVMTIASPAEGVPEIAKRTERKRR